MVTLATAVNTTATTWALSEALPAGTEYLQADDELVAVITPAVYPSQRDEPTLFCEVLRGVAGTLASHAEGATLATLAAPPLGGGGGEQTIRLLGPYDLDHADAGLDDPWPAHYRFGEELVAGTIVMDWLVVATETWASADADITLSLGVVPTADVDLDNSQGGYQLNVKDAGNPIGFIALPWTFVIAPNHQIGAIEGPTLRIPLLTPVAGRLFAALDFSGEGAAVPTSGKARVYVLIAEPAE